jgi:hypothetical protein
MDVTIPDRPAVSRAAVLAGAGVTVVGAFLPWIVADPPLISVSRSGIDAHGTVTLVLAAVAVGAVATSARDVLGLAVVCLCGAGIAAVGSVYVADLAYGYDLVPAEGIVETVGKEIADPATGVYVTLVGGALVLAGGVVGFARR